MGSVRGASLLILNMEQVNMAATNLATDKQERKIPILFGQFDGYTKLILTLWVSPYGQKSHSQSCQSNAVKWAFHCMVIYRAPVMGQTWSPSYPNSHFMDTQDLWVLPEGTSPADGRNRIEASFPIQLSHVHSPSCSELFFNSKLASPVSFPPNAASFLL